MKRKLISTITAAALLLSLFTAAPVSAASGANSYSSAKALTYAKNHWNDGKGDCVAFVRACVEYGGIPRDTDRDYGYTPKQYKDYLTKNGYAEVYELTTDYYYADYQGIYAAANEGKIAPGDIILYHCNNKNCPKPDFHMSIAKGSDGTLNGKYKGWITCYAHNTAVNNKVACKIKCSRCGASKNTITMYAIHFKSKENGYYSYTGKVSGLQAKASYNEVSLTWKTLSSADGYTVYRATSKSGSYKKVGEVKEAAFRDDTVLTGKTYYYKVKPYKTVNDKDSPGSYSIAVSAKTSLSAPKLTVKKSGRTAAVLTWTKVDGAEGYRIYRNTKKTGTYSVLKTVTDENTLTYTNKSLKKGRRYYYKAKSWRMQNGSRVYSAYSGYKSVLM